MPLVQPYLEWEIKFNEKYLKGSLAQFVPFAPFYDICVRNKIKVTVNQMRALAAGKEHRHPDDNAIKLGLRPLGTSRGDLFVYDEAPDEPEDDKVPQAVAVYYVGIKALELGDETMIPDRKGCTGFLSFDKLKAQFPKLFDEAGIKTLEEYKAISKDK